MKSIGKVAVDVDHGLRVFVTDAGTIRLAYGARADDNQELGFRHRKVAADRSFRTADMHVLRMGVRQHASRARGKHHGSASGLRQPSDSRILSARSASGLDRDLACFANHRSGTIDRVIISRRELWQHGPAWQSCNIDCHRRWLSVQRQQQIERPGTVWMVHAQGAAAHRIAQPLRRVQNIRLAHDRGHATEQALLLLWHLLHVVAFAEGRFVSVDMIDADAVRRRRERAGKSLHRAWSNRRNDRRQLAILPAKGRGRVCHLHFVAAIDGPCRAFFFIDAQDIAEIGRAVPEDRKILAHALFQKTENERLRKRHLGQLGQALFERLLDAAGFGNRARALARLQ